MLRQLSKSSHKYKDIPHDEWVEQPIFCKQYGYERQLIRGRRRCGIWLEGVHWRSMMVGAKKRILINKSAIERWLKENS